MFSSSGWVDSVIDVASCGVGVGSGGSVTGAILPWGVRLDSVLHRLRRFGVSHCMTDIYFLLPIICT